ncbi:MULTISPECIES: ERF family protein [Desulfovibrio]|uniref:ERF superfamily protein n=1 Tax=Desulfovibrio desulfuricans TaxID=876 RepID=A0AA94HUV9_DESDE|nr:MULTISPECIES: ERF family protein [Desulfovibrio]ATD82522.1 single-stranded DNA-binding protein [Desulfovibrio sp. G11]SFW70148.1 ERF superfamily protein [Desulfovibrio desulfuricans]SPD35321.1 Essential recombination function protein [Desulfovibrio sp. G11]
MTPYQSENITELAKALLNVQRIVRPIAKDAENPFTKSWYASLNSVMDACRDALIENGIWLCQYPVPVEQPNSLGLVTKLTHAESGQWQSSLAVVPLPKADPQGMGSAITYCRRYALTAMLGMVTEDDDGEGAKNGRKSASRSKLPVNSPETRKAAPRNANTENTSSTPSNRPSANLESLPRLEGITYQQVTAQDGRPCIIATGNTQAKKELLTGAGFRWNAQRKLWWKYVDAA